MAQAVRKKTTGTADSLPRAIGKTIRKMRLLRRMTLDQLAERSQVSRRMVLAVEQGVTNASIAVLARIANGLDVSVARIVQDGSRSTAIVVRSGEALPLWDGHNGALGTLRIGSLPPDRVELWDARIPAGVEVEGDLHPSGTQELLYELAGTLTVTVGDDEHVLRPGDAIAFAADRPHRYLNRGSVPLHLIMVTIQPPTVDLPTKARVREGKVAG